MTFKETEHKLLEDLIKIEPYLNNNGVLPEQYCHWIHSARTQRLNEIAMGKGLAGTMGFENKGCYNCYPENLLCEYK